MAGGSKITGSISGPGGPGAQVTISKIGSTQLVTADALGNWGPLSESAGTYTVTPANAFYVFMPALQVVTLGSGTLNVVFSSSYGMPSFSGNLIAQIAQAIALLQGNGAVPLRSISEMADAIAALWNTGILPNRHISNMRASVIALLAAQGLTFPLPYGLE